MEKYVELKSSFTISLLERLSKYECVSELPHKDFDSNKIFQYKFALNAYSDSLLNVYDEDLLTTKVPFLSGYDKLVIKECFSGLNFEQIKNIGTNIDVKDKFSKIESDLSEKIHNMNKFNLDNITINTAPDIVKTKYSFVLSETKDYTEKVIAEKAKIKNFIKRLQALSLIHI